MRDMDLRSYGLLVNSFYELEPDYVDYYTKKLGRRAWHIGPFLPCNKEVEDKARTGKNSDIDEHECLEWLDSKKLNSVVYVCFGSVCNFTAAQLHDIAKGLEASGQDFISVVRNCVDEEDSKKWLPRRFEERTNGKVLLMKGWAPQLLILGHEAVGAYLTHCEWNSTLEGVCSGVPLVTCVALVCRTISQRKIGDRCFEVWHWCWRSTVERICCGCCERRSFRQWSIMVDEEALDRIRERCKTLKEMARMAIEEGGSSYSDFNALMQELSAYQQGNKSEQV